MPTHNCGWVLIGMKNMDLALVVTIPNAKDFAMTAMTAPRGVEACLTDTHRRGRGIGGRRSNVSDRKSQRCAGHIRRWRTVCISRSLLCMKHGGPQEPEMQSTRQALEHCVRPQGLAQRRSRQVLEHCLQPQGPVLRGSRRAWFGNHHNRRSRFGKKR